MKSGTHKPITHGYNQKEGHWGIDMVSLPEGSGGKKGELGPPIYAATAGRIFKICASGTPEFPGFGQSIVIDHRKYRGGITVYGHMWNACETGLKRGDLVLPGQLIAYVGNNGTSTAPHLHFEVCPNDYTAHTQIDPLPWLQAAVQPDSD